MAPTTADTGPRMMMPQAAEQAPVVVPSPRLEAQLEALRRKLAAVTVGTGAAELVSVSVCLLATGMVLDWAIELPLGVRAVLLLADLVLLGGIIGLRILAPVLRGADIDDAALMVERAHPAFRTRLIAAVQLTRPGALREGASASLVRALVDETEALAAPLHFPAIVRLDRLARAAGPAVLLLAAGIAAFVWGGESSVDLLKRVFLSSTPVPRKTRVSVVDGDKVVALGDTVRLEAVASGIIPASGLVRLDFEGSDREQTFAADPVPGNTARFVREIENVQDSFRYTFYLNDGRSPGHTVRAVPRPAVAFLECQQIYPAYTRLESVRRAPGDLMLLAGSRLRVTPIANKEVRSGVARLIGDRDQDLPLEVDPASPRKTSVEIPIPAAGLTGFSIHFLDQDGLASRNPAVYRIDIVPDRAPAVRVTYPDRKEELVTPQARMIVGFEASDDYAIGRVRLRYRIDRVEENAEKALELDLAGQSPRALRRRFEWRLAALQPQPPVGSTIEYWMEVEDNNNVTGPGISASDHYIAKVVGEEEKRADLMNRLSEYLGTLTDVTAEQEKLSESLGDLIQEKRGP